MICNVNVISKQTLTVAPYPLDEICFGWLH